MNMKTAASRSGLSARAIRFYIDSGLLSPEEFISRGRRDYEFTEEDVCLSYTSDAADELEV